MKRGHKTAKAFLKACTVLLIGLWVTWVCLAQATFSAVITGVVRDERSQSVPYAFVRLYDREGNLIRETRTNVTGTYRMDFFGNYPLDAFERLEITHEGYRAVRVELPADFVAKQYFRWDVILRPLPVMTVPEHTTITEGLMIMRLVVTDEGRLEGRVTWGGKPLVNQSIVWAARQDTSALNTFNWLPADVIIDRVDTDQDGRFVLDIPSVRGTYLLVVDTAQFTYFQPVQFAVGR